MMGISRFSFPKKIICTSNRANRHKRELLSKLRYRSRKWFILHRKGLLLDDAKCVFIVSFRGIIVRCIDGGPTFRSYL